MKRHSSSVKKETELAGHLDTQLTQNCPGVPYYRGRERYGQEALTGRPNKPPSDNITKQINRENIKDLITTLLKNECL